MAAIQRQAAPVPNTLLYNKMTGKQYLMGQTVPGLYAKQTITGQQAMDSGLVAKPKPKQYANALEAKLAYQQESAAAAKTALAAVPKGVNPKLYFQQQNAAAAAAKNAELAAKGLTPGRGGSYTLAATDPASLGLAAGWAPQIGHITTQAATVKARTNPLLAAPVEAGKKKNPFVISQTPSADLFGINIPS